MKMVNFIQVFLDYLLIIKRIKKVQEMLYNLFLYNFFLLYIKMSEIDALTYYPKKTET